MERKLTGLERHIRIVLENPCISTAFWAYVHGESGVNLSGWKDKYRKKFERENQKAINALQGGKIADLLHLIFYRLYVLRNQVVHGGATHPYNVGKKQVVEGSHLLKSLISSVIHIMEQDIKARPSTRYWGKVWYPSFSPEELEKRGVEKPCLNNQRASRRSKGCILL
ncbi:MAG: hypothetical protein OXE78_08245 [Gammaproteobacteria bacterium]|nr:hypothetical protein [Gammaproteobacteria bacterium]MCY4357910.1 hypothetical protein [Gammaproteobacteria bacterium]